LHFFTYELLTAVTRKITLHKETLEGSAHDNGRTMVRAEYGNTEGSPNPNGQTRNQRLSVHPKELILGTTRNETIARELASRSAHQIQYVIVVIVNVVFKV
jgi:hypothetical protein